MTRLDIGRMNKDYVDPTHYHEQLATHTESEHPRRGLVSLDIIRAGVENQEMTKVKTLLRNNELPVQHEARTQLWTLLCCGSTDSVQQDDTFQQYAAKFESVAHEKVMPIHDMTDEMRAHHMLSEEGVRACHKVLYFISETHPQIRQFSPLLYAFTSVMLHYVDEETCFYSVCALLKRKDIKYFLAPTVLSVNASSYVLKDLAYRYTKGAAVYIEQRSGGEDLTLFCSDWVLWIFKHLPFQYLVRIVDCYLVEGFKVLYRIALTVLKLFHSHSAKTSGFFDSDKPDAGIRKFCEQIAQHCSSDKLLKLAFGIRGLSKKEIDDLFIKNEQIVRKTNPMGLPSPRPSVTTTPGSQAEGQQPKRKGDLLKKIGTKKSFKLDKDFHTQIVLEDITSEILDKKLQYKLWMWLPPSEAVKEPELVFTTAEDGYSLKTFYEKVEHAGPVLLIMRTIDGEVLGGYCSADWVQRRQFFDSGAHINYFGNGQSFVFRANDHVIMQYPWVGKNQPFTPSGSSMFQAGDRTMLMLGGGNGCALQIDADLDHGHTKHCDTFNNEPLVESGYFRIQCMEAFAFS